MNRVLILDAKSEECKAVVLVANLSEGDESIQLAMITDTSMSVLDKSIKTMLKENPDCTTLVYSRNLLRPDILRVLEMITPHYVTLLELEDYGFNEKTCASAYDLFEWLKSRNVCTVLIDIYKKLTERRRNLNALDYYLFPKQLIPLLCDIPHMFHLLPPVFQSDKIISQYEYCYKHHNNNVDSRCQFDGPPPIKLNCETCKKEEK